MILVQQGETYIRISKSRNVKPTALTLIVGQLIEGGKGREGQQRLVYP